MSDDSTDTTDPIDQILADFEGVRSAERAAGIANGPKITYETQMLKMFAELVHAVRYAAVTLDELKELAESTVFEDQGQVH